MIDLNEKVKSEIVDTLRKNDVMSAFLFGSYVRNEQKESSDLDILVKLKSNYSLFDLLGIRLSLEDRLGIKVDVVPEDSLVPEIAENVLKERVRLF